MATSRLKIYNGALLILGSRSIADLTVNEESRRLLDEVWNDDGVRNCLEAGQWKFAMRNSQFSYETAITPEYGYRRAFAKPDDWVVTSGVSLDEYFRIPFLQYQDEASYWYADEDELYIRYVSNHADFGMDFSKWPANFTQYVKTYFASRICMKVTNDKALFEAMMKRNGLLDMALKTARNTDAMGDPPKFLPTGAWNQARRRGGTRGDGGSNTNLIG